MIQGPIKQLKVNIKGSKQNEVNPLDCLDGKVTQGNLNRENTYTGSRTDGKNLLIWSVNS